MTREKALETLADLLAEKLTSKNPGIFMRRDVCDERSGAIQKRITWLYALVAAVLVAVVVGYFT